MVKLRRHTSPTFLTDLNQLNSIDSIDLLPDVIADDGPNATTGQALSKWLNIPRSDGKPKQLICCGGESETIEWITNFKEAFLRATTPSVSYKIRHTVFESTGIESFELTNERTNEMLTLENEENDDEYIDLVLKRCQIGKAIQWEDKKTDNVYKVNFDLLNVDCIGPLSPPESGKMNSKAPLEMNPGPSGEQKK